MWKRTVCGLLAAVLTGSLLTGCAADVSKGTEKKPEAQGTDQNIGKTDPETEKDTGKNDPETEIQVFIAASLNNVMTELAEQYSQR